MIIKIIDNEQCILYGDLEQSILFYSRKCLVTYIVPSSTYTYSYCRRVDMERDETFWFYTLMAYIELRSNIDNDFLD